MRTVTINIYKIDELSKKAQRRAYEHWLQKAEYPWHDDNVKTLRKFEEIFPLKISEFEYGGGRNYIHFIFTEYKDIENLSGIRLLKYIYQNYYKYLFTLKTYYTITKTDFLKSRKSKIQYIVYDCPLTGCYMDEEILKPIRDFLKKPENITFYVLIKRCLDAWLDACDRDYESYFSFESFLNIASINKYKYLENGDEANVAIL